MGRRNEITRMKRIYYHGGKRGLKVGDLLVPAPPHVEDGCPICRARAAGRVITAAEFRAWLRQFGPEAEYALRLLENAPDDMPIDPPSDRPEVYITTHRGYARWYAARSRGDLYRVVPLGRLKPSTEDVFPTWTTPAARIVEVVERRVLLTRRDRRALDREWRRAQKALLSSGLVSEPETSEEQLDAEDLSRLSEV